MSENTKIEWADHSWSPWRGCTKVSPGCQNCYAETLSRRNPSVLGNWGKGAQRVLAKNWSDPAKWNSRTEPGDQFPKVFPSLCDWLDDEVPIAWTARFLHLVYKTPYLDWLLLTKRPENWDRRLLEAAQELSDHSPAASHWIALWRRGQAPRNVWFGVSVEDQPRTSRIKHAIRIPAAVRWVSAEPLIAPVDFTNVYFDDTKATENVLNNRVSEFAAKTLGPTPLNRIDWIVVGGESGPKARGCNVSWVREIVLQGKAWGVPVFVKQLGAKPCVTHKHGSTVPPDDFRAFSHPKAGDPSEWPEDLRVREYPI